MLPALVTVSTLLCLGYVMRRSGRLPESAADALNRIVIDVCVPAIILRLVPKLSIEPSLAVLAVVPWFIAGLAYVTAAVAARALRLDAAHRTVLFLATALGNTSFLGFPLCGALLGESSIALAAVYDQLGSFLLLSLIAPIALGRVAAGPRPRFGDVVRRVLLFPPFIALVVALLPVPQPDFIQPLLTAAAASLVPLAMLAVGLKLRLSPPRPLSVFSLGLGLKLVGFPLVAWGLVTLLDVPPMVEKVAVLETAMPTMITAGALMMAYDVCSELAAAFVGWGLVLSLVTVPAWSFFLN